MKKYEGICGKYEGITRKYEGICKKYKKISQKYEGIIMKKICRYIGFRTPISIWTLGLGKIPRPNFFLGCGT